MAGKRPIPPTRLVVYAVILAAIIAGLIYAALTPSLNGPPPFVKAYDGPSEGLEATVIVPTLDTPMPPDKNVIWCASFQLAWNEMRDEIVGEPIRIENAGQIADRLNDAKVTKDDLVPGSYYAKAGAVADGVIEQIQADMAAQFPDAPTPEIAASSEAVVSYAYLAANVKFTIPFFENQEPFLFDGFPVRSFGIRKKDEYAHSKLRGQIEILYSDHDYEDNPRAKYEFALDPCKDSSPNQIIVACIEAGESLAETLGELETKMAKWSDSDWGRRFHENEVLLVPSMSWRLDHHFRELEGTDKRILNERSAAAGYYINVASQVIDFRLERTGADLKSRADLDAESAEPRYFIFNRPFLIVMKKRGAERPFFVMWVENAELLCKP